MSDVLSDMLRVVRLRGAIFSYVECTDPWVAETPRSREIIPAIMPGVEHLMPFHGVATGTCWASLADDEPVRLDEGDRDARFVGPRGSRAPERERRAPERERRADESRQDEERALSASHGTILSGGATSPQVAVGRSVDASSAAGMSGRNSSTASVEPPLIQTSDLNPTWC